jgi:dihydrofolate synthase / folylpolyglutamate synthase
MDRLSDTLAWLYSLEARGEIYKLERMERAMALLGDPHLRLTVVHIAGTKGKGSVAAMLDAMLRAAGYRCGLHTSPHLVRLNERIRINGAEIPSALMLDYIDKLRAIYERARLDLTFFEFTVAMTFLYFAEAQVDLAVIETGLGGRLDSTNVVRPLLSVITPIGFDHMDRLGYTIPAIAAEKGGIIKVGIPVVIGARDPQARATLTAIATERNSPARLLDRDFSYRSYAPAHRIDYHGSTLDLHDVELGLAGPFQHENAAIALAAIESLRASGRQIDEPAIRRGLAEVRWPGRFDIVSRRPLVLLDGAHNELSIRVLLDAIAVELGPQVRPRLIFGCQADKQSDQMAALLRARIKDVTLTRAKPKRPAEPEDLMPLFSPFVPTRIVKDPLEAVERVMAEATPDEVILVAGSVYLVGEIYPWFLSRQGRQGLFPEAAA